MLRKILTLVAGALLLVLGVMFSVVILAVGVVVGLAVWAYLLWKTRKLRQAIREQAAQQPSPNGDVIEGEAVVVEEFHEPAGLLPPDPSRKDF